MEPRECSTSYIRRIFGESLATLGCMTECPYHTSPPRLLAFLTPSDSSNLSTCRDPIKSSQAMLITSFLSPSQIIAFSRTEKSSAVSKASAKNLTPKPSLELGYIRVEIAVRSLMNISNTLVSNQHRIRNFSSIAWPVTLSK